MSNHLLGQLAAEKWEQMELAVLGIGFSRRVYGHKVKMRPAGIEWSGELVEREIVQKRVVGMRERIKTLYGICIKSLGHYN